MTDRTAQYEIEILRVSLARIAQACGPAIEREIPGGARNWNSPNSRASRASTTAAGIVWPRSSSAIAAVRLSKEKDNE